MVNSQIPSSEDQIGKDYQALKNLLQSDRNQGIQRYLRKLSSTAETNYSL